MLTHDQLQQAVELLQDLVSVSPIVGVDRSFHLGHCFYCGERVRNVHSQVIHHTEDCYWWKAKQFADSLPSEWD